MVAESIEKFDADRYDLDRFIVMPNHVHVIMVQFRGCPLGRVVQGWKNYTARRINEYLGREGKLWSPDYFDRYIRDEGHLFDARAYVRNNPVMAGLCREPGDWPFGSVGRVERGTPAWPGVALAKPGFRRRSLGEAWVPPERMG